MCGSRSRSPAWSGSCTQSPGTRSWPERSSPSSTSPEVSIRWEVDGAVGIGLIDRPERRNALSTELCHELRRCLVEHQDLRAVVLGGVGDQAFCAGADLDQ